MMKFPRCDYREVFSFKKYPLLKVIFVVLSGTLLFMKIFYFAIQGGREIFTKYSISNDQSGHQRGCTNPGFKSSQWCETHCWDGQELFLPDAVIEPKCSEYDHKDLLLYIYSSAYNFAARETVRREYGYYFNTSKSAIVFLTGYPPSMDAVSEKALTEEISRYGDMLRLNFKDTYKNLTFKGLGFFKWINKCGNNFEFVAKNDDNELNAMSDLYSGYQRLKKLEPAFQWNKIFCLIPMLNIPVYERKIKRGWELERWEYFGEEWPNYCKGDGGTFIPKVVIFRLLEAAKNTKVLRIEDAYFTGLLRHRACVELHVIMPF